jgi:predicted GIY-YIG superfamily endonuclease
VWFVYILECSDGSFYTGISNDVAARLKQHNEGKGSKYIRSKRPAALIYSEELDTKSQALKREAEIKGLTRNEKEQLVRKK